MSAILFGSISTIVDTSELQRRAFNDAFEAHGLGWTWDRDDYVAMLATSGGQSRVEAYAASRGQSVDAAAVHRTKSAFFQRLLAEVRVAARPGVVDTLRSAKADGVKTALVTTTSADNITAVLDAAGADLSPADFDLVVDGSDVDQPKPDGAAYTFALAHLGEDVEHCVAVEDNVDGVGAAVAAGLTCVAFPNENTTTQDFGAASQVVDLVDYARLRALRLAGVPSGEAS